MGDTKTLRDLLDSESYDTRLAVRTVIPAKVKSYTSATQRAKVELSTRGRVILDDGRVVTQPVVVLDSVPVVWPACGDGYIHADLAGGDTGVVLVCDRSISTWRTTGQAGEAAHPFPHNLGDAIFLPGLRPDVKPLTPPPRAGTTVQGSEIHLGAASVLGVARKTDTVAADAALAQFTAQAVAAIAELQATVAALGKPPAAPAPAPIIVGQNVCRISGASSKVTSE